MQGLNKNKVMDLHLIQSFQLYASAAAHRRLTSTLLNIKRELTSNGALNSGAAEYFILSQFLKIKRAQIFSDIGNNLKSDLKSNLKSVANGFITHYFTKP